MGLWCGEKCTERKREGTYGNGMQRNRRKRMYGKEGDVLGSVYEVKNAFIINLE